MFRLFDLLIGSGLRSALRCEQVYGWVRFCQGFPAVSPLTLASGIGKFSDHQTGKDFARLYFGRRERSENAERPERLAKSRP
jgi:hypothetical protein